jgi:hypothetical protein
MNYFSREIAVKKNRSTGWALHLPGFYDPDAHKRLQVAGERVIHRVFLL